jgi:hypothetical protein
MKASGSCRDVPTSDSESDSILKKLPRGATTICAGLFPTGPRWGAQSAFENPVGAKMLTVPNRQRNTSV